MYDTCQSCESAMTYYGGTKEDGPFFYCRKCDSISFVYDPKKT